MIASQIRFLYYMNRGEFAWRRRTASRSSCTPRTSDRAWQVETWEAAALIPLYTSLSDIVALTARSTARSSAWVRPCPR